MIKKFNEFVSESFKPNEGKRGSSKVSLDDKDLALFQTEGALRNLITNEKISLLNNDVWYYKDDEDTVRVLKNYFTVTEAIDINNIKDIESGTAVIYKGSTYTVDDNDGFSLTLIDEDGETIDVNYAMFSKSGGVQ